MTRKIAFLLTLPLLIAGASLAQPKPEFRGVWVTAWSHGFLTPAEADETIRLAKLANMNAIMIQVRKTGDAYYKSNYEPRAKLSDPGYDPLGYMIEKAHKEGIQVHAWLNTFRVTTKAGPSDPNHVLNLHPDWANVKADGTKIGSEGMFLDPGNPEAQNWLFNVCMDIVKNYDVDGIHLDYIRYPGRDFGYSEVALARFNKETGRTGRPDPKDPAWSQWRRDQVTALVRRVYKAVKAIKPKVKVTASVITRGSCPESFSATEPYVYLFQNWEAWAKEGIIDALVPMNYQHGERYLSWLEGIKRWRGNKQAYTGIAVALNWNSPVDAERTVREIKQARERGLDGACGFAFNEAPWRESFCKTLRGTVYQEPAPVP